MNRKKGSHLTYEERCQIYAYLKSGMSYRAIRCKLKVSLSTISRELKRNTKRNNYNFVTAHELAEKRRQSASGRQRKLTPRIIALINDMLNSCQASPVQIAGRLKHTAQGSVSHQTIYTFIHQDKAAGGKLYTKLRRKSKRYQYAKGAIRGAIPGRVDIGERPDIVTKKERVGDFECDTIIGAKHKGAIVSIVDRATKLAFLRVVDRATSDNVQAALFDALRPLAKHQLVKTMTSDNGREFASHRTIEMHLGGKFYFARPYRSCDRGLNEHTNGLVRQYFPKGTFFTTISQEQVDHVEKILNNRPRKILNFKTPYEAFAALTQLNQSVAFRT